MMGVDTHHGPFDGVVAGFQGRNFDRERVSVVTYFG